MRIGAVCTAAQLSAQKQLQRAAAEIRDADAAWETPRLIRSEILAKTSLAATLWAGRLPASLVQELLQETASPSPHSPR